MWEISAAYSDKGGWKPPASVLGGAVPPVLLRHVGYSHKVAGSEPQLVRVHGHVVPQGLGVRKILFFDHLCTTVTPAQITKGQSIINQMINTILQADGGKNETNDRKQAEHI